jgi:hypothetical protein
MTQTERLYDLLSDYEPHSTPQILREVYGGAHLGIARISARIYDLSRGKWSGKRRLKINSWRDRENPTVFWYQLAIPKAQQTSLSLQGGYVSQLHH